MSSDLEAHYPSLGFILEGHGEFEAFPVIVSKVWGQPCGLVPRSRPTGFGTIVRRLEEELDDLVKTYHPKHIIICLDLNDPIKQRRYANCKALVEDFSSRILEWRTGRSGVPTFEPMPVRVTTVVQIKKFETWMIADQNNLQTHACFAEMEMQEWQDVDVDCENPVKWIIENSDGTFRSKNPSEAKGLFSLLDVGVIASKSKSFQKFVKEILIAKPAYE